MCNYNIDFYIKCSNLLSFELVKYLKFLHWGLHEGLHPQTPASNSNLFQKQLCCKKGKAKKGQVTERLKDVISL